MDKILALREKIKGKRRKIALPEGEDVRVVEAAQIIVSEGLADVYLLGKQDEVNKLAKENAISLEGVNLVDPFTYDRRDEIVNAYYEKRKHKGITPEDATKTVMRDFTYYAAMMANMNIVDGFVSGASHTTSNVARAAIHCLEIDREIGTVSSSFIMELEDRSFGTEGLFVYGDCGIIPFPTPEQLAGITIATSDIFCELFAIRPCVAMLSYSTKGSAKSDSINVILDALSMVKEKRPELKVDGELQLDAAIIPEVAQVKCPNSEVAGKANVLIFPNLDAGNIAYKLTQRLAKAKAVGPLIQGLNRPCSDLSRGCSSEDIVNAVCVTAVRAQNFSSCKL